MDSGRLCCWHQDQARPTLRTDGELRAFLEHLVTRGTMADLAQVKFAWCETPSPEDEANWRAWWDQFGDSSDLWLTRQELLPIVVELLRVSKAPAARKLSAAAWLDEWCELPQPALGYQAPLHSNVEAVKAVIRALQARVSEKPLER